MAQASPSLPTLHPLCPRSLFRVLGGLWPLTRGRIYKPGGTSDDAEGGLSHLVFYVPQVGSGGGLPARCLPSSSPAKLAPTCPAPSLTRCLPPGLLPLPSSAFPRLPQRPYVTQGTLQEQLIYPLTASPECRIPDDQLRALLASVDLEHLLERWVGLGRVGGVGSRVCGLGYVVGDTLVHAFLWG